MSDKMREGRCHCGTVRFALTLPEILQGSRCNCSICAMKGYVAIYVPLNSLHVIEGADQLGSYGFHTKVAEHHFCKQCGIHCFHKTRSNPDQYAVNAACIDGISPFDFAEIPVTDGQNHAKDNGQKKRLAGYLRFKRITN